LLALVFAAGGLEALVFARASAAVGLPAGTAGLRGLMLPPGFDAHFSAQATGAGDPPAGTGGLGNCILPPGFDALVLAQATGAGDPPAGTDGLGNCILPAGFDVLVSADSPVALLSLSTPELFELSLCVVQSSEGLSQVLRMNGLFCCLFFLVFNIFFSPLGGGIGAPWSTRFCGLNGFRVLRMSALFFCSPFLGFFICVRPGSIV
jgi:hypothetical protein